MRKGFYPGSFDPPTFGHFDIIRRSLALVDRLVIGIGVSPTKQAIFSVDERIEMLLEELSAERDQIETISFDGLLVDAATQSDANLIIRGLRNASDFDYEAQMSATNSKMVPDVETVFLAAAPEIAFISSTQIRQIARLKGDVSSFVPGHISHKLKEKL